MSLVDLLRHGVAQGEPCIGACDATPLSPEGWSQMRAAIACEAPPWEGVVSSPLERCAAFAREFAGRHALALRFEPRLRELGWGSWTGRPQASLTEVEAQRWCEFWRYPGRNPAPGGEDYPDFERRVVSAWDELLESGRGQHRLLITHGGTIRVILGRVLGVPATRLCRIEVPYACLSRVRHEGATRLVFHGGRL